MADVEIRTHRMNGRTYLVWNDPKTGARLRRVARSEAPAAIAIQAEEIRAEYRDAGGATVADALAFYREDRGRKSIRVRRLGEFQERIILPVFGMLKPAAITRAVVNDFITDRRAGKYGKGPASDTTIAEDLTYLRSALRYAHRHRIIEGDLPVIEPPRRGPPREVWLSKAELARLRDACVAEHIRVVVSLMIWTGARVGALLALPWSRVDLGRGLIDLREPDTDAHRHKPAAVVPINSKAVEMLAELKSRARTAFVVEYKAKRVGRIGKAFDSALSRAGLPRDVTPHDVRRSAARLLVEAGRSMDEVADFLGHRSTDVTRKVYARFSPDHMRKAKEVLDF